MIIYNTKGLFFVIKNCDNQYLLSVTIDGEWWSNSIKDACNYTSSVVFDDADRLGGKVFLRTKIREIEVSREDFGFE